MDSLSPLLSFLGLITIVVAALFVAWWLQTLAVFAERTAQFRKIVTNLESDKVHLLLQVDAQLTMIGALIQPHPYPYLMPPIPPPPATPASPRSSRLMAVLPDVGLDLSMEADALRQSGGPWELVLLEGDKAVRATINQELLKGGGARLLYLATHGMNGELLLSGQDIVTRSWLAGIVRFHNIEVVVMNSCHSDELTTALDAAGITTSVVTTDAIHHKQAIRFALEFLTSLARGDTIERAVSYARLSVNDATGEIVRVRGQGGWAWQ